MENFDIAKYLKENHLGPHSILGGYVDLHALKEVEDMEGLEIVKGFGALKDKSVADKYAEVCKQGGMKGVKVIEKDGVFKIYANAGQKLNKEAEDLKDIETSDLKKGDTVEYEGTKYIIGDFDTAGGANLVYLKTVDGEPAEDSKGRYKKVHKSRVKKLNKEADYGNNEPVDKVPYGDGEGRLDGFGDEFDQVAPVEEANKNHKFKVVIPTSGVTRNQLEFMNDNDIDIQDISDGNDFDNEKNQFTAPNEQALKLMIAKFYPKRLGLGKKEVLDLINTIKPIASPVVKGMNDDDSENPFPSIMKEKKDSMIFDKGWQYDDDDVDAEDDMDPDTRFADLGGDQIKTAIKSLMDDGFDSREIAQFVVDTIRGFKSFKG